MVDKVANLRLKFEKSSWFKLNKEERINRIEINIKENWVDNWNFTIDVVKEKDLKEIIQNCKKLPPHMENNINVAIPIMLNGE